MPSRADIIRVSFVGCGPRGRYESNSRMDCFSSIEGDNSSSLLNGFEECIGGDSYPASQLGSTQATENGCDIHKEISGR